jgi:signal transduction histidine kinase
VETTPNAFPARRRILVWGLLPSFLTAVFVFVRLPILTRADRGVYDAMLRVDVAKPPHRSIVIVDIDERSLAALGQWPWRRDLIGRMVARLREMGAASVALDVVFPEADRHGGPVEVPQFDEGGRADRLHASAASDAALADVLRNAAGHVVLGYAFTFERAAGDPGPCVLHPIGLARIDRPQAEDQFLLARASGAICSLPVLSRAAGASGFLNAIQDADGVVRRVPLLLEFDGRVYPGLALAAVAATTGIHDAELQVGVNSGSLLVAGRIVPLDGGANLSVRYRGTKRTFPYISAADVLAGGLSADVFRDKIVFVGATALGTSEAVSTPLGTLFAVEVQATVADNLLREDFIRRPLHAAAIEAAITIALGLAAGWLVGRAGMLAGAVAAVAVSGLLWGGAVWLFSRDGIFLSPLPPTIGLVTALAAVMFATLTEQRRVAQAAAYSARREREAERHVRSQFLMTLSHELRTPLTTIYGWAQMLTRGTLKDEQKRHAISTIERKAQEEIRLIDDLLNLSRITRGRLQLDARAVSVPAIVEGAVDAVRPAAVAKGIHLQTSIAPGIEPILADAERLHQVVWNLLSNAIKFTPKGGSVQAVVRRTDSHVEIAVSDTGVGISSEFLPHVFEQFRQQDAGTTRRHGGLGLGLAIVRHLVEQHGGSVRVESEGEGRGATFRVFLPTRPARDAPAEHEQ